MATVTKNLDATFTFTFTARELATITRMANTNDAGPITDVQLLTDKVNGHLNEAMVRFRDRDAAERQRRYDEASPEVRAQLDELLGLDA